MQNIKTKKIIDSDKLKNINTELKILEDQSKKIMVSDIHALDELVSQLQQINEDLWDIENFKRECEAEKDFGDSFIKLSRDVHFKNDIRAKTKSVSFSGKKSKLLCDPPKNPFPLMPPDPIAILD